MQNIAQMLAGLKNTDSKIHCKHQYFNNMPFEKGKSGNPNGRPKGAKSRTSEEIRTLLLDFIDSNVSTLQEEFNKLDAEKKLNFIDKMLKHVLPPQITDLSQLSEENLDVLLNRLKQQTDEQTK
jgi:hypothetical protein